MALVVLGHTVWDYAEARELKTAVVTFAPGYGDYARDPASPVLVPPTDDAAPYYLAAGDLVSFHDEATVKQRQQIATVRADVEKGILSSSSRAFLQAWIETRRNALLMLDEAATRSFGGFRGPRYPDVWELVKVKNLSSYRAIWQADAGEANAAARSLVAELKIEGSERSPVLRQGGMTWIESWRGVTAADTQFVLSVSQPDERALRELEDAFAAADADTQLTRYFINLRDRALNGDFGRMGHYAESYAQAGVLGEGLWTPASTTFLQRLMRPVAARGIRSKLQEYANLIEASKTPWPGRIDKMVAAGVPGSKSDSLLNRIRISTTDLASLRAARMAVAVERFRRTHNGDLPADAKELVPMLLPALPIDPFSGSPMVMSRTAGGYVIYSVGPNRQDDRGKEAGSKPILPTDTWDAARMTGDIGVRIQTAKR